MRVYVAARVLPVASPPLDHGAVAVDRGRIVAVGPRRAVQTAAGSQAEWCDLGDVALLPGLVNAHCHVELSWLGADAPRGGDFVTWIRDLLERRATVNPVREREAAAQAVAFMVSRGTVAVGDVANGTWVAPILARSPLHGVVFHEVFAPLTADAERLLDEAARHQEAIAADPDVRAARGRLDLVLTPHAPHTVSEPLLRALARRSAATRVPLSIHVAESLAESAFLDHGAGPFADLLRERGLLEAGWTAPGLTPVAYLDRLGVLGPLTLAVHCVQVLPPDDSTLRRCEVHVVTCPRSNERLGVGRAPLARLLALGIPVALGTDSLASSPDLDLFAELAALIRLHPDIAPAAALRMATLSGAAALGLADRLGSIEPGKLARLVAVPLSRPTDDPFDTLGSKPEQVWPVEEAPWLSQ